MRQAKRRRLRWLKTRSHTLLTLAWLLSAIGCSRRAENCNYTLTCGNFDAAAGGQTSNGGATGTGGKAADSGAPDASVCATTCSGKTPRCDTGLKQCVQCEDAGDCSGDAGVCNPNTHQCVECLSNTNCETAAPYCEADAGNCVQCRSNADCPGVANSVCSSGTCTPCTEDSDCAHLSGTTSCKLNSTGNAGTCVQCTIATEATVCGGYSCNPATNACTKTTLGSVEICGQCVADSDCDSSQGTAGCIPMNFNGSSVGGYCLRVEGSGCTVPYSVPITAVSLSNADSASYCGIDQSVTSCKAVLDLTSGKTVCRNDDNCGLGLGDGLCRTVGTIADRCTIPCGSALKLS